MSNTSGQGKQAVVPDEVKGWSWGAFWLSFVWGAYHKVYLAFLIFVPVVGFFALIWLGMKGNEWAWQNKHWSSVTQFKRAQQKWARWGLAINVLMIGGSIALGILSAMQEEEEAAANQTMAEPQPSRSQSENAPESHAAVPATLPQSASSTVATEHAQASAVSEVVSKSAQTTTPSQTYTPPKAVPVPPVEHNLSPDDAAQILFRGSSLFGESNHETSKTERKNSAP